MDLKYIICICIILIILLVYLYFNKVGKNIHGLWKSDEYHIFIENTTNPYKKISVMNNNDEASKGTMMIFPLNTMQDKEKYMCYLKCKFDLPKYSVIVVDNNKGILIIEDKEFVKI